MFLINFLNKKMLSKENLLFKEPWSQKNMFWTAKKSFTNFLGLLLIIMDKMWRKGDIFIEV